MYRQVVAAVAVPLCNTPAHNCGTIYARYTVATHSHARTHPPTTYTNLAGVHHCKHTHRHTFTPHTRPFAHTHEHAARLPTPPRIVHAAGTNMERGMSLMAKPCSSASGAASRAAIRCRRTAYNRTLVPRPSADTYRHVTITIGHGPIFASCRSSDTFDHICDQVTATTTVATVRNSCRDSPPTTRSLPQQVGGGRAAGGGGASRADRGSAWPAPGASRRGASIAGRPEARCLSSFAGPGVEESSESTV